VVEDRPPEPMFKVQFVGEKRGVLSDPQNWSVRLDATVDDVAWTDLVFIPSLWMGVEETFAGRYSKLKKWIVDRYHAGATICAACTGVTLLADTGLLDDEIATTHWAYVDSLCRQYPKIKVRGEKVLVEAGSDARLITSGSHASWYDLLLYAISRFGGKEAALQTAKFFLLQWHTAGQSPYMAFRENVHHGDAAIRQAQEWLRSHYSHPNVVDALEKQSGLPSRTFKRRFKQVTGLTPISYVQQLRVDRAKALLETSDTPIEQIGWRVGYEDITYFRRLFKRVTNLRPGDYRTRFKLPRATSART